MKISGLRAFTFLLLFIPAALIAQAQAETKTPRELHLEVESYLVNKSRELASQGKRVDVEKREELVRDKKLLAEKYNRHHYFKGIRHLIHDEPNADWLLQENVIESFNNVL